MEYDQFRAMNTEIVLAAEGEYSRLTEGFRRVRAFIAAKEAQFTRFTDSSELAALNRAAGTWFTATPGLFEVVRLARDLHEQTAGLFDPSILPALKEVGYDRSMDLIRAGGSGPALTLAAQPPQARGLARMLLDPLTSSILLPQGTQLDLGGIAKGWIAERGAELLAAFAEACTVNAGGDLFSIGTPSGEPAWQIALEDPLDPAQSLATIRVGDGAVATSSLTRRRWMQGDLARHHIIDPRTGLPAETDWLSVTVIAPHAPSAEAFAKALLIAGSQAGDRLIAPYPDITFIGVRSDHTLWGSSRSPEYLEYANAVPDSITG